MSDQDIGVVDDNAPVEKPAELAEVPEDRAVADPLVDFGVALPAPLQHGVEVH